MKHLKEGHNDVWAINLREGEDFVTEAVENGLIPDKTYFQVRQLLLPGKIRFFLGRKSRADII